MGVPLPQFTHTCIPQLLVAGPRGICLVFPKPKRGRGGGLEQRGVNNKDLGFSGTLWVQMRTWSIRWTTAPSPAAEPAQGGFLGQPRPWGPVEAPPAPQPPTAASPLPLRRLQSR